ncbi:MAG: P13 family porin [Leptospirales bacterium]
MKKIKAMLIICSLLLVATQTQAVESNKVQTENFYESTIVPTMPVMPLNSWSPQYDGFMLTGSGGMAPKTGMWVGFGINFFVGFGIGSYVQGDSLAGTIGLIGDLSGGGLIIGGYLTALSAASKILLGQDGSADLATSVTLYVIGGIVLGASRIYQLIAPFVFYNKNAAYLFDSNRKVSMFLTPNLHVDPLVNTVSVDGVNVGMNHRF